MKNRNPFDYRENLRRANERAQAWLELMNALSAADIPLVNVQEPDIEPLTYEELITPADALLAHALGVRLD